MDASKSGRRGADRRRALWHAVAAFACLWAGVLAGARLHSDTVVWMSAVTGFLFLARFLRRAFVLWEIDSPVFEDSDRPVRVLDRFRGLVGSPPLASGERLEPGADRRS